MSEGPGPAPSESIVSRQQAQDPRVVLAAERTLLAWLRTGLAMMGFGFVVARFGLFLREIAAASPLTSSSSPRFQTGHAGLSLWIGTAMIGLGVVVNVLAAIGHVRFLGRLERGEPYRPTRWSVGVIVAVVLAVLGVGMTAYLLTIGV
jgi:putative membrane protein